MKKTFVKIVNWIKQGLSFIKEVFELGKWVIMIVLAVSTWSGIKSCSNQKLEKQNFISIAKNEQKIRETESGKFATERQQWIIDKDQLKQKISREQAKNSEYLNALNEANETIKDLNIKLKRVDNYNKILLESKDSIKTEIVFVESDKIKIKPIKKKHIEIEFVQDGKYLDVNYVYRADIETVIYREKDNEQFFIWRWFNPNWIYNSVTTIDDPSATVSNKIDIKFN